MFDKLGKGHCNALGAPVGWALEPPISRGRIHENISIYQEMEIKAFTRRVYINPGILSHFRKQKYYPAAAPPHATPPRSGYPTWVLKQCWMKTSGQRYFFHINYSVN